MLYVVKLNALNDSPSLMGIEEHIPDVWNVCRECRCCWFQCSNVIFKVGRESVTRVSFFYTVWHFSECSLWWSRGVWDQWQLDSFQMSANHWLILLPSTIIQAITWAGQCLLLLLESITSIKETKRHFQIKDGQLVVEVRQWIIWAILARFYILPRSTESCSEEVRSGKL